MRAVHGDMTQPCPQQKANLDSTFHGSSALEHELSQDEPSLLSNF